MANSSKQPSKLDFEQIFKNAANDSEKSVAVSGFLDAKVGHRFERTAVNATTDDFSFYDDVLLIKTIRVVYASSAKEEINSAERIA